MICFFLVDQALCVYCHAFTPSKKFPLKETLTHDANTLGRGRAIEFVNLACNAGAHAIVLIAGVRLHGPHNTASAMDSHAQDA